MLHQALEMTEPCSNEDMKARLLFEIQAMRKQSTSLVTLPVRGLNSIKCEWSPLSQLLSNKIGERKALAGVQGIKIKLHTFSLFEQRDTAQGVKWMWWGWDCCCASKECKLCSVSQRDVIMGPFRAHSVTGTMMAITAEARHVQKPLCHRL